MPTSFIVCTVMWFIHGFVLDIFIIGVLPFLSVKKADAERADKSDRPASPARLHYPSPVPYLSST